MCHNTYLAVNVQRCDPPEQRFAQSWPAIRDWGPYSPDKTDGASSSSDSDSDIEVEQTLLDDAQRTFWKNHPEGKPKTGSGFMLQAYILAVLIIVWLHVACCKTNGPHMQAQRCSSGTFILIAPVVTPVTVIAAI